VPTSVCVLGYGPVAQAVVKRIKSKEGYNVDFRVHCVHVSDNKAEKYQSLTTVIEEPGNNWLTVLADGTENTKDRTPFGSDIEWLLDSIGHNVVVDCTSYNEDSTKLIFDLIKRGNNFYYMFPDKQLVRNHWKELIQNVKIYGGQISFNSIVAGDLSEWSELDLNQSNFHLYAENDDLYKFRNGGPEEVADVIVKDVFDFLEVELVRAREWEAMSDEEKEAAQKHWKEQEEERIKSAEAEKLRLSAEPCGLTDTFSWKDLD
jgi:hypothetical protein